MPLPDEGMNVCVPNIAMMCGFAMYLVISRDVFPVGRFNRLIGSLLNRLRQNIRVVQGFICCVWYLSCSAFLCGEDSVVRGRQGGLLSNCHGVYSVDGSIPLQAGLYGCFIKKVERMSNPLVTIAMSVHNGAATLGLAI